MSRPVRTRCVVDRPPTDPSPSGSQSARPGRGGAASALTLDSFQESFLWSRKGELFLNSMNTPSITAGRYDSLEHQKWRRNGFREWRTEGSEVGIRRRNAGIRRGALWPPKYYMSSADKEGNAETLFGIVLSRDKHQMHQILE
ncbi:hypothetical protein J6590_004648 [Homalodisca vitripennis]|nr:hypothetical protein J6590_004648 [Homalodisca vitripennis]